MKKLLLLFVCFISIQFLSAQFEVIPMWGNLRTGAMETDGNAQLDFTTLNVSGDSLEVQYNDQSGWTSQIATNTDTLTFGISYQVTPGQEQQFYLRQNIMNLIQLAMVKEVNTANPGINDLTFFSQDSLGDCSVSGSDHLELVSDYAGYDDNRVYVGMKNNGGGYPTLDIFSGEAYAYVALLANPESVVMDSTVYLMIETVNLGALISPGLYKIAATIDTTFDLNNIQRIGDIMSYEDSANDLLVLSCAMSDLANDPNFGTWPNTTKSLAFSTITFQITTMPSFNANIADMTNLNLMIHDHFEFTHPQNNTLPEIRNVVTDNSMGAWNVSFNYYDADGHSPQKAVLQLGSGALVDFVPATFDFTGEITFTASNVMDISGAHILVNDDDQNDVSFDLQNVSVKENDVTRPENSIIVNNPSTIGNSLNIRFSKAVKEDTEVSIFNIKGQKVHSSILHNSGNTISWNMKDVAGKQVSTGVYFIKTNNKDIKIKKIVLMK